MRSLASGTMRLLAVGLLVIGILLGVALAEVVPPLATSVAAGARDLVSQFDDAETPTPAAGLPREPGPARVPPVSWADVVERVGPAVVTVVSEVDGGVPG